MISFKPLVKRVAPLFAGLAIHLTPLTANAYTECTVTPQKIFVGDTILWVNYSEGGVSTLPQSDPDFKPTLAVFMTAITTMKTVIVRYAADGVSCTSNQELSGVWLSR